MASAEHQLMLTLPPDQCASPADTEPKWKKTVKQVAPHVGLVLMCCVFASGGAALFLFIESPHEVQERSNSVRELGVKRSEVLDALWKHSSRGHGRFNKNRWKSAASQYLDEYGHALFAAFTTDFVRFNDIRKSVNRSSLMVVSKRDASKEHLWTKSSAVFFAATTMATIGYGNIVPVTGAGRVVCVLFALIGAPLAIITIGDLGKFMSECTIWLYKHCKSAQSSLMQSGRSVMRRVRSGPGSVLTEVLEHTPDTPHSNHLPGNTFDWDELVLDKTQVPVMFVFTLLLTYIALGAVLFMYVEQWTYVDSFYFCFITLTTVGFGDLVPHETDYLVLMLLYIGVGLSVTTMCIDLVGIQYIERIHYFGRKLKGTDFMTLLRRKQMLKKQMELAGKAGNRQLLDEIIQQLEATDHIQDEKVDAWSVDNVYPTPSLLSLASSAEDRAMMYRQRQFTTSSWSESGPDVSCASVASTSASVHERLALYSQWHKHPEHGQSVLSFACGAVTGCGASTLASQASLHRRRLMYGRPAWYSPSTSQLTFADEPPSPGPSPDTPLSIRELLFHGPQHPASPLSFVSDAISELFSIDSHSERTRALMYNLMDTRPPSALSYLSQWSDSSLPYSNPDSETTARELMIEIHEQTADSPLSFRQDSRQSWSSVVDSESCQRIRMFNLDNVRPDTASSFSSGAQSPLSSDSSIQRREFMFADVRWTSPPSSPEEFLFEPSFDLAAIASSARQARRLNSCPEPYMPAPPSPLGIVFMEQWDNYAAMLEQSKRPWIRPPDLEYDAASSSDEDIEPPSLLSPLPTEFPLSPSPVQYLRPPTGVFDLVVEPVPYTEQPVPQTASLISHEQRPVHSVHHDTVHIAAALESLMAAPDGVISEHVPQTLVKDNYCFVVDADRVQISDITDDDPLWKHTGRPTNYFYSDDLKKFKRVNVVCAKGRLISARLSNTAVMTSSSGSSTPKKPMLRRAGTVKQAGRFGATTRRLIESKRQRPSLSQQSSSESVYSTSSGIGAGTSGNQDDVPLCSVYKVTRFYSFWRTCTSFHRIVTVIAAATKTTVPFKRRLFVQYLWRNAKPSDRALVAKQFDPANQKLLRFVDT